MIWRSIVGVSNCSALTPAAATTDVQVLDDGDSRVVVNDGPGIITSMAARVTTIGANREARVAEMRIRPAIDAWLTPWTAAHSMFAMNDPISDVLDMISQDVANEWRRRR